MYESTFNNDHQNNGWQQPTPVEMAPECRTLSLVPHAVSLLDGRWPPKQAGIILWGLRKCMALKTLQCCGNASLPEQRSTFSNIDPLNPSKQYIHLLRGLFPIRLTHHCATWGLIWGIRGPFPPEAVMVVTVIVCVCSVPEHEPFLFGHTMAYWVMPKSSWLK